MKLSRYWADQQYFPRGPATVPRKYMQSCFYKVNFIAIYFFY